MVIADGTEELVQKPALEARFFQSTLQAPTCPWPAPPHVLPLASTTLYWLIPKFHKIQAPSAGHAWHLEQDWCAALIEPFFLSLPSERLTSVTDSPSQHLIGPYGFKLDDKSVLRAGLDYWPHVDLREHPGSSFFPALPLK